MNTWDMERGISIFLKGLGLDIADQHLKRTPERVVKAWTETFGSGYLVSDEDIENMLSVEFDDKYDSMIVVKDIPFISHCSHHLIPFIGTAKIGYVPKGKIVGLSKLARVLDVFAYRLQVQERLTEQVADTLEKYLDPAGVGVVLSARHMCMTSRGARKPGSMMITSCLLGDMRTDKSMREEFLNF
jgi:GTP cyclohydrolase I